MGRLDDILKKNKMTEKGVIGIYSLFAQKNIKLLKDLTHFTQKDIDGIGKIKGCIENISLKIASDFYEYLLNIEETAKIINSRPDLLDQLILTQSHYINQLFGIEYDENYFINRVIVGFAHYVYKISPSVYIGSYGYYNTLITDAVIKCCKENGIDSEESVSILNSVQKMLSIDITLAIESYYQKTIDDVYKMEHDSLNRLMVLAEYRDEDTGNHIARMSHFAAVIAKELGMDGVYRENILNSAPMHDIGKVGIPDNILLKPGRLDKDEFEIMKSHTVIGYNILKDSESNTLKEGAAIALSHHENYDGSGYPNGLKGDSIPLSGRITKVADVFDALINKRIYKPAYTLKETLRIMKDEMKPGAAFDPDCFDAFLKGLDEILDIRRKIDEENS
ncbi:MAG: protoglobin domain-containing protein [Deltaproteobacteria bacterium]|nr:protoglobin domain-containing protein [Deltaproteobacteria bacterium]